MASKSAKTNNSQAGVLESIHYAFVTFLKDNVSKVVPIDYIKVDRNQQGNFYLSHCSDFDSKHKYYVQWYYCDKGGDRCDNAECNHEFDFYSAFIKYLGETKDNIQQQSQGKRKPATNKKYISTTESDDEGGKSDEVDEVNELKKVKIGIQNKKKVAVKGRDEIVLKKLTKAFELPVFSDSHNKVTDVQNINSQKISLLKNITVQLEDINARGQASQNKDDSQKENACSQTQSQSAGSSPMSESSISNNSVPINRSKRRSVNRLLFESPTQSDKEDTAVSPLTLSHRWNFDNLFQNSKEMSPNRNRPQPPEISNRNVIAENNNSRSSQRQVDAANVTKAADEGTAAKLIEAADPGTAANVTEAADEGTAANGDVSAADGVIPRVRPQNADDNNDRARNFNQNANDNQNEGVIDNEIQNEGVIDAENQEQNGEEIPDSEGECIKAKKFVLQCVLYYERAREGHALQEKERRYTANENGEIYLGENISIDKIKWDFLQVESPSYFFSGLALHLWGGPRQLANRALDLSRVKDNIPGRSPVKLIEANLLRLQISLYFDYLRRDRTLTNVERAKLVSESITNMRFKIRDLRRNEKKIAARNEPGNGNANAAQRKRMRYNFKRT